jgi:hypothetical protein
VSGKEQCSDLHSSKERLADFVTELAGMSPDEGSYFAAYVQAKDQLSRTPLLLRAVFAAAVGTIEPLVTRLV